MDAQKINCSVLPVVLPYSAAHVIGRHKHNPNELPLTSSKNRPHPNSTERYRCSEDIQFLLHIEACATLPRQRHMMGLATGTWDGRAPLETEVTLIKSFES